MGFSVFRKIYFCKSELAKGLNLTRENGKIVNKVSRNLCRLNEHNFFWRTFLLFCRVIQKGKCMHLRSISFSRPLFSSDRISTQFNSLALFPSQTKCSFHQSGWTTKIIPQHGRSTQSTFPSLCFTSILSQVFIFLKNFSEVKVKLCVFVFSEDKKTVLLFVKLHYVRTYVRTSLFDYIVDNYS